MKRVICILAVAIAAIAAGSATKAHAYASTDHCYNPWTHADALTRTVQQGYSRWNLTYYFACAVGDGPRVGLQRRGCAGCDISTIFAKATTSGEGYNLPKWNSIPDGADEDHCQPSLQYRMFVQSYDAGAYSIDYTPWHDGSAWIACP